MATSRWTREQLLVALRLYCGEPFGRLHTGNPAVHRAAQLVGRTPSAVVFKACNFASLDPTHQSRGVAAGSVGRQAGWPRRIHADSTPNRKRLRGHPLRF